MNIAPNGAPYLGTVIDCLGCGQPLRPKLIGKSVLCAGCEAAHEQEQHKKEVIEQLHRANGRVRT